MIAQAPLTPHPTCQWATERAARVCELLHVSFADFCGAGRMAKVVRAREVAAYLCYFYQDPKCLCISYPELARAMGRANYSTVITAVRRVEASPEKLELVACIADVLGLKRHPLKS